MNLLVQVITWINVLANALGKFLLGPIAVLPGWLSNTIVSAIVGVVLLVLFKYISNQRAIQQARDDIKANMLAMKLFKDSLSVILRSPWGVFRGVLHLLLHSLRPMLVAIVPILLLCSQLAMWYQHRPLKPGEYSVVTVSLSGSSDSPWPVVTMKPTSAVELTTGPVRIISQRQICWEIKARQDTSEPLVFQVGDQKVEKEFAVGEGFIRISDKRPGGQWGDIFWHPGEKPFSDDSAVQSISIDYPQRISWTSGADYWVGYFFVASLIAALIFKPFLKVKL